MSNPNRAASNAFPAATRLLLFDLDDTLCDYAAARAHRLRCAFQTALGSAGADDVALDEMIALSIAMHPHGTDHFQELLARYGVTEPGIVDDARDWYRSNRFLGLQLFPDAIELLSWARRVAPERRLGIITNGPADVQRAKVDLLQIEPHVDFVVVSGEFGVAKPDPEIFSEALRLGCATASETIFIGDSPEFDIAGARASAIRSVWVNRTGGPWTHDALGPDHEVTNLTELRALLEKSAGD